MKKMTVKEAMRNIRIALRRAKRTFEDGFMYQGYKDDTRKYESDSIERLKQSKSKASKLLLSRMTNILTELEDMAWEQQLKRMEQIKENEKNAKKAITVLRDNINYITSKNEECKSIIYNNKTYLKYMPKDATFEDTKIYEVVEALEKLRNELVLINQEL